MKTTKPSAKPPFKPVLIVFFALAVLFWALIDYLLLPAYNMSSFEFWVLLGLYISIVATLHGLVSAKGKRAFIRLRTGGFVILAAIVLSIGSCIIWPGNDGRYAKLLSVVLKDEKSFLSDFPDSTGRDFTGDKLILPAIDKDLSIKAAQGKLGKYGAQFTISEEIFPAISVLRGGVLKIVRVTPLDYSGGLVAFSGGSRGTIGYLEVDQTSAEGKLVEVPGGMKYTPGAVLSYDLLRHVRFSFRTELLGSVGFEIDDSGRPWWIIPVLKNTVGLFGGLDSDGVIAVDPVSGEMKRYAIGQEPEWIDRVVPTDIVQSQANDALSLGEGWINSVFGEKRGVFQLSDGYNYEFSDQGGKGRTWFISGITSPNESDQTLNGFMMVNMKTKEARRYAVAGITEMRAREIAVSDERVKAQALSATWPILTGLGGEPVYFLLLKNQVQRQRFVYLDAAAGQRVAMGETLEKARADFARISGSKPALDAPPAVVAGVVFRVRENARDGTVSFLLVGAPGMLYAADSALTNGIRFIEPGDRVEISYRESPAMPGRRFVTGLRNSTVGE